MPRISLTDFVDFVSSSGTPKATKVSQIKNRPPYHPAQDYYKQIREHLINVHESNQAKSALDKLTNETIYEKKFENYLLILNGYKKWWGRKKLNWFEPSSTIFSHHGIDVSINPELGLYIEKKTTSYKTLLQVGQTC